MRYSPQPQPCFSAYHKAGEKEVEYAINSALKAWEDWSNTSLEERIKIFQKMADLLAGPQRDTINAATMLGQSKNVFQAEIDAACELIDFLILIVNIYTIFINRT